MPRRSAEERKQRAISTRHHEVLMAKVERLIARVYGVKDEHHHLMVWWGVAALEVYKRQATLMYKLLMTNKLTDRDLPDFEALRDEISESLEHICDALKPLLKR